MSPLNNSCLSSLFASATNTPYSLPYGRMKAICAAPELPSSLPLNPEAQSSSRQFFAAFNHSKPTSAGTPRPPSHNHPFRRRRSRIPSRDFMRNTVPRKLHRWLLAFGHYWPCICKREPDGGGVRNYGGEALPRVCNPRLDSRAPGCIDNVGRNTIWKAVSTQLRRWNREICHNRPETRPLESPP